MEERTTIVLVGFLLVFAVVYGLVYSKRARSLLEGWAGESGVDLVRAERTLFRKGPFLWSSRGQAVFRVEVLDGQGNSQYGWVRCGHWLFGVFVDQVEVKWDDGRENP